MRLVKLALACAIVSPVLAAPAAAQDAPTSGSPASASKLALAREVVDLGFPAAGREAMFFKSMDQMMGQMRDAALQSLPPQDPGALVILDTWLGQYAAKSKITLREHIPALMNSIALAYADVLSDAELQGLRDYLASPAGHGFLARNADILANPHFAKANQDYMNAVVANLPTEQDKLRAELEAYYTDKAKQK